MDGEFEATVEKILASGKITRDELMARIQRKWLDSVMAWEDAAWMVGRELGVKE